MLRGLGILLIRFFFGKANDSRTGKSVAGLVSFVIAALLWIFLTLTGDFNAQLRVPLRLDAGKGSRQVIAPPPSHLDAVITGRGWELAFFLAVHAPDTLVLEAKGNDSIMVFGNEDLARLLQATLQAPLEVKQIKSAPIALAFSRKTTRTVPIHWAGSFSSRDTRYQVSPEVSLSPAEVLISGPGPTIDTITEWLTEISTIEIRDPAQSRDSVWLAKPPPRLERVEVWPPKVAIHFHQQRVAEVVISARLKPVGFPSGDEVHFFPETVQFICLTPVDSFDLVKAFHNKSIDLEVQMSDLPLSRDTFIPSDSILPTYLQVIYRKPADIRYLWTVAHPQ